MTATLETAPAIIPARAMGRPRLTAGLDRADRVGLAQHTALHGPLASLDRPALQALAEQARLLGRGGAAFPVAAKLRSLPRRGAAAVVVNGSEGEPASQKDRLLMRRAPHLVLDGLEVVGAALRARQLVVAVHDPLSARSLQVALSERPRSRRPIRIASTPDRFVSGEARAVLEGLGGRTALPTGRRTLPTHQGLDGKPTFLSNAETFAQLAVLVRVGQAFGAVGSPEEPGTSLFSVGGTPSGVAVVEAPTGVLLTDLLSFAGADPTSTVLLGGYHGMVVGRPDGLALSRPSLREQGLSLGAGIVLALSHETCSLGELTAAADYLADASAGQCGPCVFGLPAVADDLRRTGRGDREARGRLTRRLGLLPGRGACAHPDGASRLIASFLTAVPHEVDLHLTHGSCGRPVRGELPLPRGRR